MARILVVSRMLDEGRGIARMLRRDGHRTDIAKTDSAALRAISARRPEMMILALPDPSSTMRALGRELGSGIRSIPAIAVVKEHEGERVDHDVPGLMELLATPFAENSFLARVDALIRVRGVLFDRSQIRDGSDPVNPILPEPARKGAMRRLLQILTDPRRSPLSRKDRPLEPYLETAASIVGVVEGRDSLDPGHGMRVSAHCASIAAFLGLSEEETEMLLFAGTVHDIGKIALSAELLGKPALSDGDRKVMRLHPRRSAELIRALTPYEEVADIVLNHHERPDGKGYYGRRADEVPRLSRALSVAEVFDAMTTSRRSRPPLSPEEAVEALLAGRGTAYDAESVDALAAAVRPHRTVVPLSPSPLHQPRH